jgi:hypothetical protein
VKDPEVDVRLICSGPHYDVVVQYPDQPELRIRVKSRSLYVATDAAVDAIESIRCHELVLLTWTLEGTRRQPEPFVIDRVGSTPLPNKLPLWGRD